MAVRQLAGPSAQEDPVSLDAALAHPTPAEDGIVPAAIQLEMQPPPISVARICTPTGSLPAAHCSTPSGGSDYPDSNKTLDSHILRLRRKLDPQSPAPRIRTVRGTGCILDVEAARLTRRR